MRYAIEGFEDYEIDEHKQVFRKPTAWRTGRSVKHQPECQMKVDTSGKYRLRRRGIQHGFTPDQIFAMRKENK